MSPAFEIVGGGAASAEEVVAIAAALEIVLGSPSERPPLGRWRWSARRWPDGRADWRGLPTDARPPGS